MTAPSPREHIHISTMIETRRYLQLAAGILIGYVLHGIMATRQNQEAPSPSLMQLPNAKMKEPLTLSTVEWIMGSPQDFANEYNKGCRGLSDKTDDAHNFHKMYQPQLSRYIRNEVAKTQSSSIPGTATRSGHRDNVDGGIVKLRMLEIGLGCAPGGGMIKGKPGGSAYAWRHLFNLIPQDILQFELHVFEYDEDCANKWAQENTPHIANKVHVGDASSEQDLERAYRESGGIPFDIIIDDASHINWHQIKTLDYMLPKVRNNGGLFFMEDIQSSCRGWNANMGSYRGEDVGGASNCMETSKTEEREQNKTSPTILAHLMEYQKCLVGIRDYEREDKTEFLKNVESIEIQSNIAVLKKHE